MTCTLQAIFYCPTYLLIYFKKNIQKSQYHKQIKKVKLRYCKMQTVIIFSNYYIYCIYDRVWQAIWAAGSLAWHLMNWNKHIHSALVILPACLLIIYMKRNLISLPIFQCSQHFSKAFGCVSVKSTALLFHWSIYLMILCVHVCIYLPAILRRTDSCEEWFLQLVPMEAEAPQTQFLTTFQ